MDRRRMNDVAAPEEPGRQELVVGREQRRRVVQDMHAACGERPECPEAVVHAVERRKHVQPTECGVTRT